MKGYEFLVQKYNTIEMFSSILLIRSETGQIFFILKFLRSLIFKAALHQLCDLATNKVRKKLAIYEDLSYCLCIVSLLHAGEHKVHI